jgi:hypothetical protein
VEIDEKCMMEAEKFNACNLTSIWNKKQTHLRDRFVYIAETIYNKDESVIAHRWRNFLLGSED